MPDRLAEVVNVKDFGAKGDGATNDTKAIQAAYRKGVMFFPAGEYPVDTPLTLTGKKQRKR